MRGLEDGQREDRNDRHKDSAEGRQIIGQLVGHARVASGARS